MDDWFLVSLSSLVSVRVPSPDLEQGRNDTYVTLVEASLSRALSTLPERPKSNNDEPMSNQEYGTVPPHFYRELARTVEGCRLLKDSGHFEIFAGNIREGWKEQDDKEAMLKVKGSLWAVGNIGAMELGAAFLEESDVVGWIVQMATGSQVMTMRGTAFFVLGLISRSLHGLEILAEYGWTAATDDSGKSSGYCLPTRLESLLLMGRAGDGWTADARSLPAERQSIKLQTDSDPVHSRVLAVVTDLSNTVLTKKAAGELHGMKAKSPELFVSVALYKKVMGVLEGYNFRLQVRRFVIDLFDKGIVKKIVQEEDSGSET